MILGVVSDTHNHTSNVERIIDIFNTKNVDKVIHTGDITQAKTLSRFARLNCPLLGVYGNNDLEEKGLAETARKNKFNFQSPPFSLKIEERKIVIFHEPDAIDSFVKEHPSIDLIIHGHTHRPNIHELEINNKNVKRLVLGDWYKSAYLLKYENEKIIIDKKSLINQKVHNS